jgi:hypothetical protein
MKVWWSSARRQSVFTRWHFPSAPVPRPEVRRHEDLSYTGKVSGVIYDRFGDFDGFTIRLESGHERFFRGREHAIEELIRTAWLQHNVVSVYVDRDANDWPETIILERVPRP